MSRTWESDARRLGIDPAAVRAGPLKPIPRPGRWIIRLPGYRPKFDNQLIGRHPMMIHRLKRRDALMMDKARLAFAVPQASIYRRRVTLTIVDRFRRLPDDAAPLKSFCDALTNAGLIVDDSRQWLEMVFPPTFIRGAARETTIVIEDLVDPSETQPPRESGVAYPDDDTAHEEG